MKLLSWREHPAAREELREAARWYEDQEAGLGDRLADEVAVGVASVRAWPNVAQLYRDHQRVPAIRRKGIEVFPYGIIYFVRDDEVIVVAYAHEKRRPGYWRERLESI